MFTLDGNPRGRSSITLIFRQFKLVNGERQCRRRRLPSSTLGQIFSAKFGMSQTYGAGPLVGIGFGVLLLILGLIAGIWWYCRRSRRSSSQGHVVTLSQPDPKQQTSVYSQQPSGYPQQPIGYPQQPLGYPQQPIGYQHQPTGYQQQQTGFSQQQTGYPQLPIIYNDQVADADLEVSNAFSPPHPGSGRSVAKPTAQYSTTLNVSSALAPPALPSRAPSPFSPMRPPHELYD